MVTAKSSCGGAGRYALVDGPGCCIEGKRCQQLRTSVAGRRFRFPHFIVTRPATERVAGVVQVLQSTRR